MSDFLDVFHDGACLKYSFPQEIFSSAVGLNSLGLRDLQEFLQSSELVTSPWHSGDNERVKRESLQSAK